MIYHERLNVQNKAERRISEQADRVYTIGRH